MTVKRIQHLGREAWELSNGVIRVVVLGGGGHIASLTLADKPAMNPLWTPPWPTIEPWRYRKAANKGDWGESPLLASIAGHSLCLHYFGDPSTAEKELGADGHGEAGVVRWKQLERNVTSRHARLRVGAELSNAGLRVIRSITLRPNSNIVEFSEEMENLLWRDTPFTFAEHVTFGPPFLKPGVTLFDMSCDVGHTFPKTFSEDQRLLTDTAFDWPIGPGVGGERVNLRTIGKRPRSNSDFTAQHMDPGREDAWFSAVNPEEGVLVAYHWDRRDFPWVGSWEENFSRDFAPWNGRTLARGMEFANTPFPTNLREQVSRGTMHGDPAFAWLPAREKIRVDYRATILNVTRKTLGVSDVRPSGNGLKIDLIV
ncbi:MAG: hypothetical protein ACOX5G_12050 [Kiritimatiellia bacterium]|jgi:hypothetical protein